MSVLYSNGYWKSTVSGALSKFMFKRVHTAIIVGKKCSEAYLIFQNAYSNETIKCFLLMWATDISILFSVTQFVVGSTSSYTKKCLNIIIWNIISYNNIK